MTGESDLLRRAATLARETANAATRAEPGEPPQPWVADADTTAIGPRDSCGRDTCAWPIAHAREFDDDGEPLPAVANMRHIALWHPQVAYAVAEWLDSVAATWERQTRMIAPGVRPAGVDHALATARALLGEEPGQ